jgi:hypothetical protein
MEAIQLASQRQLYESTRQPNKSPRCSHLIHARQRLDLEFERLCVLPLDLHFGLQFLDEKIEPGDFRSQLLYVCSRRSWPA